MAGCAAQELLKQAQAGTVNHLQTLLCEQCGQNMVVEIVGNYTIISPLGEAANPTLCTDPELQYGEQTSQSVSRNVLHGPEWLVTT